MVRDFNVRNSSLPVLGWFMPMRYFWGQCSNILFTDPLETQDLVSNVHAAQKMEQMLRDRKKREADGCLYVWGCIA